MILLSPCRCQNQSALPYQSHFTGKNGNHFMRSLHVQMRTRGCIYMEFHRMLIPIRMPFYQGGNITDKGSAVLKKNILLRKPIIAVLTLDLIRNIWRVADDTKLARPLSEFLAIHIFNDKLLQQMLMLKSQVFREGHLSRSLVETILRGCRFRQRLFVGSFRSASIFSIVLSISFFGVNTRSLLIPLASCQLAAVYPNLTRVIQRYPMRSSEDLGRGILSSKWRTHPQTRRCLPIRDR